MMSPFTVTGGSRIAPQNCEARNVWTGPYSVKTVIAGT